MRRQIAFLSILFVILQAIPIVSCAYVEIDDAATVYRVVDGDTFDAFPVGRIRLADIDAPDSHYWLFVGCVNNGNTDIGVSRMGLSTYTRLP